MKQYKLVYFALSCAVLSACSDFNDMDSEGYQITGDQVNQTNEVVPSRVEASIAGMYSYMGTVCAAFPASVRDDDGGYPTVCLSQDLNGSDMVCANSGYNWFSVSSQYNDRTYTYANPLARYAIFYNQLKLANDIIASIDSTTTNDELKSYLGQAKAIRAFDYLGLVHYFQYNYSTSADKPCVPLVTEKTTNFTNNPRATVKEVYSQIMDDLNAAIDLLSDYDRKDDKGRINQQVAYGLRARANLYTENWAAAVADADKAMQGYTPYSSEEVNQPGFDVVDHSWIWGIVVSTTNVEKNRYATVAAHLSSFSSDGYAAGVGVYKRINTLLYRKISNTDVRKGWWVDANLHSDALKNVKWGDAQGDAVSGLVIKDVKVAFDPYTTVKFGIKSGIGTNVNDNDWPLMRVEEMMLIKAEGLAMVNSTFNEGKQFLENFVKTYRDPNYTCAASTAEALQNEIWFQRRVELWGEGFAMVDIMRLHKPVVRFHGDNYENWPDAFCFNITPDDPWLLLRIPQKEVNNNSGIVNNEGGNQPSPGQNPSLRDGVTD
ncbi:RagB/SusD family nutrient uptake outer membrane protein [uncultured Bacteroides sp.]|uniref:RagB/SusD family nutrient uptake outer membrane protein n=1 Tax=uncultured Bacteroides sp. TaxID=162156 RepID=UPI002AA638AC|nr:RagB/SusD family nutrient uptake outer membrane protein [uncultured Bacteroides sp.]